MIATIPCVICRGENPQGCPGCNGAGIHTVSGELPEQAPGYLALKSCGCGVDWVGDGIEPKFLSARREIWKTHGYRVVGVAWSPELATKLTEWAGCKHEQGAAAATAEEPAPGEQPSPRIREVELDHVSEDIDGNITHAMLMVTLDDGQSRILEVELPIPQSLLQLPT